MLSYCFWACRAAVRPVPWVGAGMYDNGGRETKGGGSMRCFKTAVGVKAAYLRGDVSVAEWWLVSL